MKNKSIIGGILLVIIPIISIVPVVNAAPSQQIVFSGTGVGTFAGTPSPFGFWYWCQKSNTNPYAANCNGAIYIYKLGIVDGVTCNSSCVSNVGDNYTLSASFKGGTFPGIECTLANKAPITKGPTNAVTMSCTKPSGSGTSTKAVVKVT